MTSQKVQMLKNRKQVQHQRKMQAGGSVAVLASTLVGLFALRINAPQTVLFQDEPPIHTRRRPPSTAKEQGLPHQPCNTLS